MTVSEKVIDGYNRDSAAGKVKLHGVSDYFAEKKRGVEEERKNLKGKYPVWEELLSLMSESELRDFGDALQSKAHFVRSRIQFLKYCASATDFTPLFHFQDSFINPATATATGFDMLDYNSAAAVDFYAPPQYPYMPCSSSSSSMENHQSLNYWPLNACDDITHYISFE